VRYIQSCFRNIIQKQAKLNERQVSRSKNIDLGYNLISLSSSLSFLRRPFDPVNTHPAAINESMR
jgi:hypothetical protein